jgi:phosphoribosylanthranilate isomerase
VNTIQICDRLQSGTHDDLRQALPGIAIIQVIHVTGSESIEEAVSVAPHVHGLLLDSGNQSKAIKELGSRTKSRLGNQQTHPGVVDVQFSWQEDSSETLPKRFNR